MKEQLSGFWGLGRWERVDWRTLQGNGNVLNLDSGGVYKFVKLIDICIFYRYIDIKWMHFIAYEIHVNEVYFLNRLLGVPSEENHISLGWLEKERLLGKQ